MSLEVVPVEPVPNLHGFVYAAKFICGVIKDGDPNAPLLPGRYETAINVLNPGPERVEITKQAIVTLREGEPPGKVSVERQESLPATTGFEIDCIDVRQLLQLPPGPAFIKGFVLIRSPTVLSVVAVYTSTV
jgi:hypothetical protein